MPWRRWNVIIVLILANYVVFGLLAALVFPVQPPAPLMRTAQPTFTPGAKPLQRVGTLTYDFLTPTAVGARATVAPTFTPTQVIAPDATVPVTAVPLIAPATFTPTATPSAP